jgi:alkylhydroperoxidase family enzyme
MTLKTLGPTKVQKAVAALLTRPASCPPALRQAIENYAARLSAGSDREPQRIPDKLIAYVDKVTRHAYQVTDLDVQRLKDAGYSEDAIFEITLCASVGASLARLERGLLAMEGSQACA